MKITSDIGNMKQMEAVLIGLCRMGLRHGVFLAHEKAETRVFQGEEPSRFQVRRYRVALDSNKRAMFNRWAAVTFVYDGRCDEATLEIPMKHLREILRRVPSWKDSIPDAEQQDTEQRRDRDATHDVGSDKTRAADTSDRGYRQQGDLHPKGRTV